MSPIAKLVRSEPVLLSVLAVVLGITAAYGSIVFRLLIVVVQKFAYGSGSDRLFSVASDLAWWHILLAPTLGGLVIGLIVYFILPERRNRGVADVIEAGALYHGRMPFMAGLGATAVAAVSIGVGASTGREGPVVLLGATLAGRLSKALSLGRSTALTLLGCGVASAVAASFNAPIAGVFFALEVVVGSYALAAFAPVVIASVTGTIIARIHIGDFPAFIVPDFGIVSYLEFPAFILLGLVSAAVAGVFMASTMLTEDMVKRIPAPAWTRPMIGGLAVGVIALLFPQVLGVGYEATNLALTTSLPLWLLIGLVIAKTAATAISIGCGFAGGVFSPSLFIGAMVGGAFGIIAGSVFPDYASSPSAYSIIGMGAVAAAVLGAPISTILIVFEITGDYGVTIAVMIAVAVATVVIQKIPGKSFFHWQLERRGVNINRDRLHDLLQSITARETMIDAARLRERHGGEGIMETGTEVSPGALVVGVDDNVESILMIMERHGVEHIAVIDHGEPRRVVGMVSRADILAIHNRALVANHD